MHEHFDLQVGDDLNSQGQIVKQFLLEDAFKFLLPNKSSTSSFFEVLESMYKLSVNKVRGDFLSDLVIMI